MADEKNIPEFARDLVTRGLDALAEKFGEKGDKPQKAIAKLANLWTNLSAEERLQVSAGIVAAATAAALAIPATVAAAKERRRARKSRSAGDETPSVKKSRKKKKAKKT